MRACLPEEYVATAGFTPDGDGIVVGTALGAFPGEVRLFDRSSGLLIWRCPTLAWSVHYNSRANRIALVKFDPEDVLDEIQVWDVGNRRLMSVIRGQYDKSNGYGSLMLSDNGRYLAFSSRDSGMYVWDIERNRMARMWKFDSVVSSVHISPSGRYVFGLWGMFGPHSKGWMWDVETGEVTMKMIRRYFSPAPGFAFSPDERYFAMQGTFGGNTFGVSLYRVPDGEPIREYYGSEDESKRLDYWGFESIVFSPDGTRLVSFYGNQYSMLWDVETGKRRDTIHHRQNAIQSGIHAYALDNDNRSLLMGFSSGHLNTWDFKEHSLVRQYLEWPYQSTSHVIQTSFSGSGKYLVAGYLYGHVRIYDAQTGDTVRTIDHTRRKVWSVNGLDVSGDDSLIAVGGRDSLLTLYHLSGGEVAWVSSNRGSPVWDVKFSPGGDRVAASSDMGIVVYDVETGDSLTVIGEPDTALFAFSPDGAELVSVGRSGRVRVWSSASGAFVRDLGVQASPKEIVWSDDGTHIATCGGDGSIRVWDGQSGGLIHLVHHESGSVNGVAFTPDSRYLLSGGEDETLRVWHLGGGFEVYRYRDFPVAVTTLSVSGNGKYIATASKDRSFDYRLIVRHGVESYVSVPDARASATLSSSFTVSPNPSRGDVRVSFVLSGPSHVRLRVVDALGRVLSEPVNGVMREGRHEFPLPVGGFAPGTYFCRLESGDERVTRALALPK